MKKISTKSIFISILLIVMSATPTIAKVHCKDNNTDIFAPTECVYTNENSSKRSTTRIFAYNGHITEDTVWDKDVIINGDVFVDEGVTLTITEGVSVQFIRIDVNGDNLGDIFFNVNGNLITNGTEGNPVVFKSYEDQPSKSDWKGIVMGNSVSKLYYTNIFYAVNGLSLKNSTDVVFHYGNVSSSNQHGIIMNSYSNLYLFNILISNNNANGIDYSSNDFLEIHNSTISNNGGIGIRSDNSREASLLIVNSSILSNKSQGIYNRYRLITIHDSEISNNGSHGILLHECLNKNIFQRSIVKNNQNGLLVYNTNLELTDCNFANNNECGIQMANSSNIKTDQCSYDNNTSHGLYASNSTVDIINCKLRNNLKYGVKLHNSISTCEQLILSNNSVGIEINGNSSNAIINHCEIFSSKQDGVYFTNNSKGSVSHCSIYQNQDTGIKVTDNSKPILLFNNVYSNKGNGLYSDKSNSVLTGCKFSNNNDCGININNSSMIKLNQNVVLSNSNHGINVLNSTITIISCLVQNNAKLGLQLHNSSSICEQSIFSSNNWGGLEINGVNSNTSINHCEIMYNKHDGLYFDNESKGTVNNCTIIQNEGFGVKILGNSTPSFMRNNVYSNKGVENFVNEGEDITNYFSYEWELNEIGEAHHPGPLPFQKIKVLSVTYQKDGDKKGSNHTLYYNN